MLAMGLKFMLTNIEEDLTFVREALEGAGGNYASLMKKLVGS